MEICHYHHHNRLFDVVKICLSHFQEGHACIWWLMTKDCVNMKDNLVTQSTWIVYVSRIHSRNHFEKSNMDTICMAHFCRTSQFHIVLNRSLKKANHISPLTIDISIHEVERAHRIENNIKFSIMTSQVLNLIYS